jgi:Tfp pilus assembly protein PilF
MHYAPPYWWRHQLYLKKGEVDSALRDLDSITENHKNHLGAFLTKARVYQELGECQAL